MKKISLLFIIAFAISTTYGQSWVFKGALPDPQPINSISVVDENIIWACGDATLCYRTTNGGSNWIAAYTGLPGGALYGISAIDASTCWVGTGTGAIYKTTNGGTSWTQQIAIANSFINGIKMFNANFGVFIGDPTASTGQVYQMRRTTNGGLNWINSPTAPPATNEFGVINAWDWLDTSTFWMGSANTLASGTTAKVFRTTTGFFGTWSSALLTGTAGSSGLYYQAIAFINATSGMAGSNSSNIRKTTDGGATWSTVTNPSGLTTFATINMHGVKGGNNTIRMMVSTGTSAYALYKTTNLGTTWTTETIPSQGSTNGFQHMQLLSATFGYAGGGAGTFFMYGTPTGVKPPANQNYPSDYSLEQNYPNPFNPTTTIKYTLPKASFVTLKIYDAIGTEVKTLANELQHAGSYSQNVDMSSLSTGIYFYTIKTEGFTDTKKMILIK
ncbi:MAG: T9SS C-terminal target domain-containing protein [Ignavibacteriae bacterium]|nr:MAG: T9SS C-terminal target domain-containing protein [Ignavibacteriota bacterium]